MRLLWKPLFLAACLGIVSSCAPSEADDTFNENAPADPGEVKNALSCGGLPSGGVLWPGQAVGSCNGRANLVYQGDGNAVVYDPVSYLWFSGTGGRSAGKMIMQTDGNLVIYDASGAAIWSSGTWNHFGATLSIQDDCNMVIYHNGQAIWAASWSRDMRCRNDPKPYMINSSGCVLRDPTYGDINQTRVDNAASKFWIQKNPGDSTRWERYGFDGSSIWLERDTTLPTGEGPGSAYDITSNGMRFPRSWHVGDVVGYDVFANYYTYQSSCSYNGQQLHWNLGRHKLRYWGPMYLGRDLGTLPEVIIIDRYNDTGVDPWQPNGVERFWYAKGLGWVKWEVWDNRPIYQGQYNSTAMWDPNWNSGDPNKIQATSPDRRRTWNWKWCGSVGFSDVCPSLHW